MRVYYPRGRRWLALPRTPSRAGARRASAPRGVAFISFMSTHVRSSRGNPDCCLRQNLWSPVPRVGATAAHTVISATAHYYYSTDALASRARYGGGGSGLRRQRRCPAAVEAPCARQHARHRDESAREHEHTGASQSRRVAGGWARAHTVCLSPSCSRARRRRPITG